MEDLKRALSNYFAETAMYAYSYSEYRPSTRQKAREKWGEEGGDSFDMAISFFANWDFDKTEWVNGHPPDKYFRGHSEDEILYNIARLMQAQHMWWSLYGDPWEHEPDTINPRCVDPHKIMCNAFLENGSTPNDEPIFSMTWDNFMPTFETQQS